MSEARRILLVSGSLRDGSTNTAVVNTARAVAPPGVEATVFDGLARLPPFNSDDDRDPLHPEVARLRSSIGAVHAVLFSTPEYAGGLPGSFKNLLDWTVGGAEMYEKPVAWINASWGPTGAADAHASLRIVLGYEGADIVEAACVKVPVVRQVIGDDGLIADVAVRAQLTAALQTLAEYRPAS